MSELLTGQQAAERLGMCERTLRGLRAKGLIPYVELSERKIRYRAEDCDEYIEAQTKRNQPCPSGNRQRPASINLKGPAAQGFMARMEIHRNELRRRA